MKKVRQKKISAKKLSDQLIEQTVLVLEDLGVSEKIITQFKSDCLVSLSSHTPSLDDSQHENKGLIV